MEPEKILKSIVNKLEENPEMENKLKEFMPALAAGVEKMKITILLTYLENIKLYEAGELQTYSCFGIKTKKELQPLVELGLDMAQAEAGIRMELFYDTYNEIAIIHNGAQETPQTPDLIAVFEVKQESEDKIINAVKQFLAMADEVKQEVEKEQKQEKLQQTNTEKEKETLEAQIETLKKEIDEALDNDDFDNFNKKTEVLSELENRLQELQQV